MYLKRAGAKIEQVILNLYPNDYIPSPTEKVYFFLHNDGRHVLQPSGQPKCIILGDGELNNYLIRNNLKLLDKVMS